MEEAYVDDPVIISKDDNDPGIDVSASFTSSIVPESWYATSSSSSIVSVPKCTNTRSEPIKKKMKHNVQPRIDETLSNVKAFEGKKVYWSFTFYKNVL